MDRGGRRSYLARVGVSRSVGRATTASTDQRSFTPIAIPAGSPRSSATRPISSARSLDRKISNIFGGSLTLIARRARRAGLGRWWGHGADPEKALAAVMGMSAGDIQVRDCPD